MQVVETQKQYTTPEEYLALEEAAESKSEYRDGEIVPMTGGTINHNRIILSFCIYLGLALRGTSYEVFTGDVRLWIPRYRTHTYPDVMVIQGEPVYHENRQDTITNPVLIVEVLSKSTKNYDRGDKFEFYRSIPEFREYITIDQYRFKVEHFAKTSEGKWVLTEYDSADAVLALSSLDFQITLRDIYERVNFEESEE
jgi:Uma2 family endonuclease